MSIDMLEVDEAEFNNNYSIIIDYLNRRYLLHKF